MVRVKRMALVIELHTYGRASLSSSTSSALSLASSSASDSSVTTFSVFDGGSEGALVATTGMIGGLEEDEVRIVLDALQSKRRDILVGLNMGIMGVVQSVTLRRARTDGSACGISENDRHERKVDFITRRISKAKATWYRYRNTMKSKKKRRWTHRTWDDVSRS